jgi:hypothetical protein
VNRKNKIAIGSGVAACVVITAATFAVVSGSSKPKPTYSTTTSTTRAVVTTTTPARLASIPIPNGSDVIFNVTSTATLQPTGQVPPSEKVTLLYTCLGSAPMYFTLNGMSTFLTTPCRNEVQSVEVPRISTSQDIVPKSPTIDIWHVVAVKGSLN